MKKTAALGKFFIVRRGNKDETEILEAYHLYIIYSYTISAIFTNMLTY
jgi:hypothetical protein